MKRLFIIFMGFLTVACDGKLKPGEYRDFDDVKPGPGIFSGESGEFVIFGPDNDCPEAEDGKQKPDDRGRKSEDRGSGRK